MYREFFKRLFDLLLALLAFALLLIPFVFVAVLLFFNNNGQPFFFQKRPGKGERIFTIIKFKTMNDRKDLNGNLLPDALRLNSIGAFIRKFSLDEIPQLLNVIRGDMSLIGPRPLLVEYLALYSQTQRRRHEVRPGITGWAQVNGRNAISWDKKFEHDIWYVDHISLCLDFKILFLTILKVFKSEDINASDKVTMEAFKGN